MAIQLHITIVPDSIMEKLVNYLKLNNVSFISDAEDYNIFFIWVMI